MSETPSLALPLLAAEQAQKHVTMNETIGVLDAIVQLAAKDRDLAAPPAAPAEGDRYIVAAGATGAWTGKSAQIALRQNGGWIFRIPREGWRCWVEDEDGLFIFDGAAWVEWGAAPSVLQNLSLLGVGTTADATNPFSAKLNKALWTAKTAAEGGDGDLRYTMNKEAAADVLSLLLQTGFSGRAEIGLIGNDDLTFKVSPNGAAWVEALRLGKDNGNAAMKSVTFSVATGVPGFTANQETAAAPSYFVLQQGGSWGVQFQTNPSKGWFEIASLAGAIQHRWHALDYMLASTGKIKFSTETNFATAGVAASDVSLARSAAHTLFADAALRVRSFTIATLPAAATVAAGAIVFCSDLGGGGGHLTSDGTSWRRATRSGQQTVATDAAFTLTTLTSAEEQKHTGTLTANRVVTLSTTSAYAGSRFRVTRTGAGAFNLDIGGLKNLTQNTWCEVVYDGAAWYLAAYGTL